MEISSYIAYVLITTGYIASPGPAVFLAINGGASIGVKKTSFILLGNTIGLGVIALISALGLGAFILTSSLLTVIVKISGACWLAYIGLNMMRTDFSYHKEDSNISLVNQKNQFHRFRDGLVLALTNPKPIIFFVSIYPQFVITNGQENKQLMLLGGTFMILSFALLNSYSFISNITVGKVLNSSRVYVFNFVFGLMFILLAILLIMPTLINA